LLFGPHHAHPTLILPPFLSLLRLPADAILGVSLFSAQAPNAFGKFNRAFMTMFKITAGDTWVDEMPFIDETGGLNQVRKNGRMRE
jgi:hypothetical protein